MSIRNTVFSFVVFLAPSLIAQPIRPEFAWWENPMNSGLNLTDAQQKQVQTVIREYRNKLIDQNAAVTKAEGDLGDIFDTVPVDNRKANDAIDKVASARADLTKTISQMSLRLRGVLTQEQWQELRKRGGGPGGRARGFGMRQGPPGDRGPGGPRRGPGGPGGPPRPPNGQPQQPNQPPPPPQGRE